MAKKSPINPDKAIDLADRKPPRAALDWSGDKQLNITLSGDCKRVLQATAHETVFNGLVSQVVLVGSGGKGIDAEATDFALGFVDAMQPQDATEALLLSQMAVTHQAVMMMARKLNHVETIPQQDSAERALNKTARTFAVQMDTLKRYRSKGQQVVRVERVTVNDGGQAIVGAVETKGRG